MGILSSCLHTRYHDIKRRRQIDDPVDIQCGILGTRGFGTLGCIVKHNRDLYALSVKHIINTRLNGENKLEHNENFVIALIKGDNDIHFPNFNGIRAESQDWTVISSKYVGYLGTKDIDSEDPKWIDCSLLGPLQPKFLKQHLFESLADQHRISAVEVTQEMPGKKAAIDDARERHLVTKTGAKSGFTVGIIVEYKYKSEVPYVTDRNGRKFSISGEDVFVVVAYDDAESKLSEREVFAEKGDSGAIVFLHNGSTQKYPEKAIGIVILSGTYILQLQGKQIECKATYCAKLSECLNLMKREPMFTDKEFHLYHHYFTPHLCLPHQNMRRVRRNSCPAKFLL